MRGGAYIHRRLSPRGYCHSCARSSTRASSDGNSVVDANGRWMTRKTRNTLGPRFGASSVSASIQLLSRLCGPLTGGADSDAVRYMSNQRTVDLVRYSEVFGALSNPNRLSIFVRLLACCGPGVSCASDTSPSACVGELGQDLGIAPSTVSHHVKELHRSGLIRVERRGQRVECWVDSETLGDLAEFFARWRGE